ncbi:hypothetical protein CY658_10960 [Variovorax sp. RO1]|uniref:DUF1353 domain-containing protein n=1 Tax=Variovorax sp. RO1 TaxID=2066034 RepID=UPI000C717308|nr:DUF1353 domain-containing protein [Variovorax sp. RO1]PLC07463.1 hypothetical protein CY658_10960 [Variovorax sp. RO1]
MTIRHWVACRCLALATTSLLAHPAFSQDFGRYEGTVQTEWLEDGRKMRLLAPFTYYDHKGRKWDAPKDWVVDGASIPQVAWTFSGGPYEGKYRNASVVHDVGCDRKAQPWEDVHEVFYYGMLASGVEPWRAKIMYAAVYHFGPRWPRFVEVRDKTWRPRDVVPPHTVGAVKGSTAMVVASGSRAISGNDGNGSKTEKVAVVAINPPEKKFTAADFEELKGRIEASSATDSVSLQEIRNFVPTKQ